MSHYECGCREWEERPCDNPNEDPEVTCPECAYGRYVEEPDDAE